MLRVLSWNWLLPLPPPTLRQLSQSCHIPTLSPSLRSLCVAGAGVPMLADGRLGVQCPWGWDYFKSLDLICALTPWFLHCFWVWCQYWWGGGGVCVQTVANISGWVQSLAVFLVLWPAVTPAQLTPQICLPPVTTSNTSTFTAANNANECSTKSTLFFFKSVKFMAIGNNMS